MQQKLCFLQQNLLDTIHKGSNFASYLLIIKKEKNMRKIELNVGMNIGTLGKLDFEKTKDRIIELYGGLKANNTEILCQLREGKYESNGVLQIEPTIVVKIYVDFFVEELATILFDTTKILCKDTFQESIAVLVHYETIESNGVLIYNDNYKGTMQWFDEDYFLNYLPTIN